MIFELVYTDWRRGIRTKDTEPGYCTVAYTKGMPGSLINCAENFAGYAYPKDEVRNPPCSLSYSVLPVGGQSYAVFCRSAPMVKSSRRVFFTHVVLGPLTELPAGVLPVDIISSPGFFRETWNEEPRLLLPSERPALPTPAPVPAGQPTAWVSLTGDAGWAGRLAQEARAGGARDTVLIVPPGADTLRLIREACAVLPLEQARTVTFNTYYNIAKRSPDIRCAWLFCLAESELGRSQRVNRKGGLFDFAAGAIPPLTETSPYIDAARAGRQFVVETPRAESAGGAEMAGPERTSAPKTRVKTRLARKVRCAAGTESGGRVPHGQAPESDGFSDSRRQRDRTPWIILAGVGALVAVLLVIVAMKVLRSPTEPSRQPAVQADTSQDEMTDPLLDSKQRDGQRPPDADPATKPPPVEKPQFVAQDTATSSPPPAVAVAPAKPAAPVPAAPAKPPPAPVFTRLVASADGSLVLKLPRPVDLAGEDLFFYTADNRALNISKRAAAFGGIPFYTCGEGYQEMRLSEGRDEVVFRGGGTNLPFLVDLEPVNPEATRHLFVLGPCATVSATRRLDPAKKGVHLTLGEGSAELLSRLQKDVPRLSWSLLAEGATNPFTCRSAAPERSEVALTAPELFAWHEGRTAELRDAVAAMAARPLETNTVLRFLSLLPPDALAAAAAQPLRLRLRSPLDARRRELTLPASLSESENSLIEFENSLKTIQYELNNSKMLMGIDGILKEQEQQKLLASTVEEARSKFNKAKDKRKTDEDAKHFAECEKKLKHAELEYDQFKKNLDRKIQAAPLHVKEFVKKQEQHSKLKSKIASLEAKLKTQGKSAEARQVIADELKRLEEWIKAIESGVSAHEVVRLLTAAKVEGLNETTRAQIHASLVDYFVNPKAGGDAWAAAQAPKEVRVKLAVVAWEGKPVYQIRIDEGVAYAPRRTSRF